MTHEGIGSRRRLATTEGGGGGPESGIGPLPRARESLRRKKPPMNKDSGRYKLPPDGRSAISVMPKHGANLPTLRESQVAKLRSLARVCRPITEEMKRILAVSRPPSVRAV